MQGGLLSIFKMKIFSRIYINSAKPLPRKYRAEFKNLMMYAGIRDDSDIYLGKAMLIGLLVAAIVLQLPKALHGVFQYPYIIAAVFGFALVQILAYLRIYFKAEDRTKKVEAALPDAFQLIAANLRSGMTPFKALKAAARENLGPLQEEIQYATSMALGTEYFSATLLRISDRIKSDLLERSLHLFTTAMRSGGNLAQVLEELAIDISETQALKRELRTSTKTYTAFIMFTIIFGTPLLLAISINFVKMISNMQSKSSGDVAGFGMGFLMGEVTITPDFLTNLSLIILFMTAVLASMLLGVINEGDQKSGLKYAVTIMVGSILIFFWAGRAVGSYLLGMS